MCRAFSCVQYSTVQSFSLLAVRMWLPRKLVATYVFFKAEIVDNLSTNVRYIFVITYILILVKLICHAKGNLYLEKIFITIALVLDVYDAE